jgi:hypothetical protein
MNNNYNSSKNNQVKYSEKLKYIQEPIGFWDILLENTFIFLWNFPKLTDFSGALVSRAEDGGQFGVTQHIADILLRQNWEPEM